MYIFFNIRWLWKNDDKCNATQSSDKLYITLTIYIMGKEIREESWENERQKEWKKWRNFFFAQDTYYRDRKHFYRLSKWLPLISLLMNINESHK